MYNDLTEGALAEAKTLHIFGTTEPQLVPIGTNAAGEVLTKVVPIPSLVVVVGDGALPDQLGVKSVQMAEETIITMRSQGMEWGPLRSLLPSDADWKRRQVYVLRCKTRRSRARNMSEVDARRYEYCLPYIFLPRLNAVKPGDFDSNVSILMPTVCNGVQVQCAFDYDWRADGDADEYVATQIRDSGWPVEITAELAAFVKARVAETKETIKKHRAELKARLDALGAEETARLDGLRFVKYYPQNATPDLSAIRSPYINRYFGRAHEVK